MLITLLEPYRTVVQHRMRSVFDVLFMRKLMQILNTVRQFRSYAELLFVRVLVNG